MKPIDITAANLREIVERGGIVIIDWWTEGCMTCRSFERVFDEAAEKNTDVVFGKVNVDDEGDLAKMFEVESTPTLMIFRDRILLFAQSGNLSMAALGDLIRQARALDMKHVHREIAKRQKIYLN